MKLGLTRACFGCRPICYTTSLPSSTLNKPQIPIFLRPPAYSATSLDLRKWHEWAKGLAVSVGSSFADADNGPDTNLLCRELNWLLQDSLEDPKHDIRQSNESLMLRTSLDDLYHLWKQRIEQRRPFQYIVGCEHWRDLVLSVQEGVLIPRPETELIVDMAFDEISKNESLGQGLWADMGTGSGALAIGIGRTLGTRGRVIATDLSPVAVSVTTYNVSRYGLQDVIEVKQGSWFEPLKGFEGKFAGIVSNPPYIPSEHIPKLQAEVGRHEPTLALDGGVGGMDYLIHLCSGAATMLRGGGFFMFETNGEEQCKLIIDFMKNELAGRFCNLNAVPDFSDIQRFVTGVRR
ncbi:hypothetical protein K2173_019361 [Erythroxylum novogranatense]|uniref:Uncharacterized protein n=1 Tax=Erythroxylum novogranatense TaxID=1862640 RepID=A0AAV8UCD1_9ROSI|nr:hypothetical protein K2173_019361 [Erythroxylum novogranatense]